MPEHAWERHARTRDRCRPPSSTNPLVSPGAGLGLQRSGHSPVMAHEEMRGCEDGITRRIWKALWVIRASTRTQLDALLESPRPKLALVEYHGCDYET